jgi:hypothetical protein
MKITRDDVNVLSTSMSGFRGNAWLIEAGGDHYAISAIDNEFGTETKAFATDEDGDVTSWTDLVTVDGWDHEACIAALLHRNA